MTFRFLYRFLSILCLLSILIPVFTARADQSQFCDAWKSSSQSAKIALIDKQSGDLIGGVDSQQWAGLRACFSRLVPPMLERVDQACRQSNVEEFDLGITIGVIIATLLVQCQGEEPTQADTKKPDSKANSFQNGLFSLRYGDVWKRIETKERGVDLLLECVSSTCGLGTTFVIGHNYNPQAKNDSVHDVLRVTNGTQLTAALRQSPGVESLRIAEEGKRQFSTLPGYYVRTNLVYSGGVSRVRETYFTFRGGYFYSANISSDPSVNEHARKASEELLATFRLN